MPLLGEPIQYIFGRVRLGQILQLANLIRNNTVVGGVLVGGDVVFADYHPVVYENFIYNVRKYYNAS